jgi:hypothetical protein
MRLEIEQIFSGSSDQSRAPVLLDDGGTLGRKSGTMK